METSISTQTKPVVLLIEDETQIRRYLRAVLSDQGYTMLECGTGKDALKILAEEKPDVVILDLGLPDLDGLELTRRLREWSTIPIIILSARDQEKDKITVLDAGADDYLTKPFGSGELLARIRVALRHSTSAQSEAEESVFCAGELKIDLARRQVFRCSEEVHLTPNEYKLLSMLVRFAGKVVTHRQLLKEVWGSQYLQESHYLRVYMGQLRHKLELDPARPRHLITEPGVGYRLKIE